jgi:hypothetical protein
LAWRWGLSSSLAYASEGVQPVPTWAGERGSYRWLEITEHELGELLRACWPLFEGRYVVITAFDSGPLVLSGDEAAAGWRQVGDLAVTPRLTRDVAVPSDQFDEWLVFAEEPSGAALAAAAAGERFVNSDAFTLWDPTAATAHRDSAAVRALQERFWEWVERLQPTAYIADGLRLFVVTRDPESYAAVAAWVGSEGW